MSTKVGRTSYCSNGFRKCNHGICVVTLENIKSEREIQDSKRQIERQRETHRETERERGKETTKRPRDQDSRPKIHDPKPKTKTKTQKKDRTGEVHDQRLIRAILET